MITKERKMNSAVPDLTPPGKPAKAPKSLAEAKGEDKPKEKKVKAEKAPADPNATKKEGGDPPRGWLRFFIQDGSVTLHGGTEPVKKETKKEETPTNTPPAT